MEANRYTEAKADDDDSEGHSKASENVDPDAEDRLILGRELAEEDDAEGHSKMS